VPTAATTGLAERLVWGKAGSVRRQGTILLRWRGHRKGVGAKASA
jgi:hypothetical protein